MRLFKYIWRIRDKFAGKAHSHVREKARRVRQIERGILNKANGLVVMIALMLLAGCAGPAQWIDVDEKDVCFRKEKGVMIYGVQEKEGEEEVAARLER
jgi:hypothetical protein